MISKEDLRQISKVETSFPTLSIYLNTDEKIIKKRDFLKFFKTKSRYVNSLVINEKDQKYLSTDIKKIEKLLNTIPTETKGIIIFANSKNHFFRSFPLLVSLENSISISETPNLLPALSLADELAPYLVVLVDQGKARLLLIDENEVTKNIVIRTQIPGGHTKGGWSQGRFARHRLKHVEEHNNKIIKALAGFKNYEHIIFAGHGKMIADLKKILPKSLQKKVIKHLLAIDMDEPVKNIINKTASVIVESVRDEDKTFLSQSLDRAHYNINKIIDLISENEVQHIFLSDSFRRQGWKCDHCKAIGLDLIDICHYCGGKINHVELAAIIVEKVLQNKNGAIHIIHDEDFDRRGGIAAVKRF